ncbi:MAG: hypothetical protein K6B41_15785 [Butyrivibrio sp.]|nr:hypothetical protein [Butyrivibrio sp.]
MSKSGDSNKKENYDEARGRVLGNIWDWFLQKPLFFRVILVVAIVTLILFFKNDGINRITSVNQNNSKNYNDNQNTSISINNSSNITIGEVNNNAVSSNSSNEVDESNDVDSLELSEEEQKNIIENDYKTAEEM